MEKASTEKIKESERRDVEIQKTDNAAIKFKFKFKDAKLQKLSKESFTSPQIPSSPYIAYSPKQNNYRLNIESSKEGDILLQQTPIIMNCNQKELTNKTPTEMEKALTEKIMQKKRNHAERQRRYRQKLRDAKLKKIAEQGSFSQPPPISPKTNQNKNRFDTNNNLVECDPLQKETPAIINCKQKTTTGKNHTDREMALIEKFKESNRKHVERNRRYRQKLKDAKLQSYANASVLCLKATKDNSGKKKVATLDNSETMPLKKFLYFEHHQQQQPGKQHHHHDHHPNHNQVTQQQQFQKQQCQVQQNLLPVKHQLIHQQEAKPQQQQQEKQNQAQHQEKTDSCQKTAFANFLSMVTSTIMSMRRNGQPIEVIVKNNDLMSCSKFQE